LPKPVAVTVTFLAVLGAWVFFRADSFQTALHMLDCMGGRNGLAHFPLDGSRLLRLNEKWYILLAALATAFLAPSSHELMGLALGPEVERKWKPSRRWAAAAALMAAVSMLLLTRVNAFIYFQF
jgi:hypothetical protein